MCLIRYAKILSLLGHLDSFPVVRETFYAIPGGPGKAKAARHPLADALQPPHAQTPVTWPTTASTCVGRGTKGIEACHHRRGSRQLPPYEQAASSAAVPGLTSHPRTLPGPAKADLPWGRCHATAAAVRAGRDAR